jgi:hypothetical protein
MVGTVRRKASEQVAALLATGSDGNSGSISSKESGGGDQNTEGVNSSAAFLAGCEAAGALQDPPPLPLDEQERALKRLAPIMLPTTDSEQTDKEASTSSPASKMLLEDEASTETTTATTADNIATAAAVAATELEAAPVISSSPAESLSPPLSADNIDFFIAARLWLSDVGLLPPDPKLEGTTTTNKVEEPSPKDTLVLQAPEQPSSASKRRRTGNGSTSSSGGGSGNVSGGSSSSTGKEAATVARFLNRLLGLRLVPQQLLFAYFTAAHDALSRAEKRRLAKGGAASGGSGGGGGGVESLRGRTVACLGPPILIGCPGQEAINGTGADGTIADGTIPDGMNQSSISASGNVAIASGAGTNAVWYQKVECDRGMTWDEAQAALGNTSAGVQEDGQDQQAVGTLWIALRAVKGEKAVLLVAPNDGARLVGNSGNSGSSSSEAGSDGKAAVSPSTAAVGGTWSESLKVFSPNSGAHALRAKALRDRYEPYIYDPSHHHQSSGDDDSGEGNDSHPKPPEELWRAEFERSSSSRMVVEHVLAGAVLLAWHATKDALKKGQAGGSGGGSNGKDGNGRAKNSGSGRRSRSNKESNDSTAPPRDDAQRLRLVRVLETNAAATGEDDSAALESAGSVAYGGGGFIGLCLPPGANADAVVASLKATFTAASANSGTNDSASGAEALKDSVEGAAVNEEATKESTMEEE